MKLTRIAALAALLASSGAFSQTPAPTPPSQDVVAEAREMAAALIGFRTVAGREAVRPMAEYLKRQFVDAGFADADLELVEGSADPGLIVRLRGAAGSTRKPVLFLAHMDVVDAKPAEWASDPWALTEKDGALYGRGIVDNKFGVLTLAQAFMRLKREGFVPDRDLVLAFSGDEETGMASAALLAERLQGAEFAINSDAGGGFRAANGRATYGYQAAEKTYATFEVIAKNPGGHSSRPRADNAIYELAAALTRIGQHHFTSRWNPVTIESFGPIAPMLDEKARTALDAFIAAPSVAAADAVIAADPSTASEFRTTCVATMLRGGIVENALPTEAAATVNCRIFPGESVAEVQAALVRAANDPKLEIKLINEPLESPVSAMPAEARRALDAVLAVRAPDAIVTPYLEAGGTDGLQFRRAGIPTIGAGPLFATETSNYSFHGIDERLPLSEFESSLDHFYLFIKALAGPPA